MKPTLYLTCAIPGAGKSTFARRFIAENPHVVYLSTDGLRAVLGRGEDDQSVSALVFSYVRNMADFFLRNGFSVLIDATNYNKRNRESLVSVGRRNKAWLTAFVFDVPFDVCVARNAARARQVPLSVLERMRDGWEGPSENEVDELIFIDQSGNSW